MTIEDALFAARQIRPYYGRAISALTPVVKEGLGTLAVDASWRLYYDPAFLEEHTVKEIGAIIAVHEVEHLLRDHDRRARACHVTPANAVAWNACADAEINDDVPAGTLPGDHVTPAKLGQKDGLLAEEYFGELPTQEAHVQHVCGGGSGAGRPLEDELPADSEDSPGIKAAEAKRLRKSVAQDVLEHAKKHGRGSVPQGVLVWADALIEKPVFDWRRELSAVVGKLSREMTRGKEDTTWARASRRSTHDILRPGTWAPKPQIGLVVDTSGSMSAEGPRVLGHVQAIIQDASVKAWSCDTVPVPLKVGAKPRFVGGGGTDLRPAIELAQRGTDIVIVITDCDTPWPGVKGKQPMIVVRLGAGDVPAWARVVDARVREAAVDA